MLFMVANLLGIMLVSCMAIPQAKVAAVLGETRLHPHQHADYFKIIIIIRLKVFVNSIYLILVFGTFNGL